METKFLGMNDLLELRTMEEGERVWTLGFNCERLEGTIHRNTEFPDVSEWFIKYDDGEECAVLDMNFVFKVKPTDKLN